MTTMPQPPSDYTPWCVTHNAALTPTNSDAHPLDETGELCCIIVAGPTPPRPTYRERREAKIERLQEWAAKREAKADAASEQAHDLASVIPFGQPILVGHHSEGCDRRYRSRISSTMDRAVEHAAKAESMQQRAAGIEAQLASSIYSDDEDAVERLRERVAKLESERDRIKLYNADCRKAAKTGGVGRLSLLSDAERDDLLKLARYAPYQLRPGNAFPAYKLSNLNGNIARNRKRLQELEHS